MFKKPLIRAGTLAAAVTAALVCGGVGMVQAQTAGAGAGGTDTTSGTGMDSGAGTGAAATPGTGTSSGAAGSAAMPDASGGTGSYGTGSGTTSGTGDAGAAGMPARSDGYTTRQSRASHPSTRYLIINDSTYLDPAYGNDVLGPAGMGHNTEPFADTGMGSYSMPAR